jgi:hypothetical protein
MLQFPPVPPASTPALTSQLGLRLGSADPALTSIPGLRGTALSAVKAQEHVKRLEAHLSLNLAAARR